MRDELPFIDEHAIVVHARAEDVWAALVELDGLFASPVAALYARAIGCADTTKSGPRPLDEGSSVPGFHVRAAAPPSELVLAGEHRFSRYTLTFRIDAADERSCHVRAESRAAFPGPHGAVYRMLVIGTGGHVFGVRRLLARIQQRAEERQRA